MKDERLIRQTVLEILSGIAPEADLAALAAGANFRRELDLDSIDFQNFVIRLCQALAVQIPDREAAKLTTLEACVEYFARVEMVPATKSGQAWQGFTSPQSPRR